MLRIPKTVEQAKLFDEENGDTLWWNAIWKEMNNVRLTFEVWEKDILELPTLGYQQITGHIIFDIKMEENFRRKARFVADGHKTKILVVMSSYSSMHSGGIPFR